MPRALLALGWCVWLATILASATINYLAGFQLGRSSFEAHAFALAGVSADAWKAIGPVIAVSLYKAKRRPLATLALLVWLICFAFAVIAALGLAAQNRASFTGDRAAQSLTYADLSRQAVETKQARDRIGVIESAAEVGAAIAAAMAKTLPNDQTIGKISGRCSRDHWRSRQACAEIATLRQKEAAAHEARRLDERLGELRSRIERLRAQGGALPADPQAELLSQLSGGVIAAADANLLIVILLACMIEAISAFAPVLLREVAQSKTLVAASEPESEVLLSEQTLLEFVRDCVAPKPGCFTSASKLFQHYKKWCRVRGHPHPERNVFGSSFDAIVNDILSEWVRRERDGYRGFRLYGTTQA